LHWRVIRGKNMTRTKNIWTILKGKIQLNTFNLDSAHKIIRRNPYF
jgi:hypothetical protein